MLFTSCSIVSTTFRSARCGTVGRNKMQSSYYSHQQNIHMSSSLFFDTHLQFFNVLIQKRLHLLLEQIKETSETSWPFSQFNLNSRTVYYEKHCDLRNLSFAILGKLSHPLKGNYLLHQKDLVQNKCIWALLWRGVFQIISHSVSVLQDLPAKVSEGQLGKKRMSIVMSKNALERRN